MKVRIETNGPTKYELGTMTSKEFEGLRNMIIEGKGLLSFSVRDESILLNVQNIISLTYMTADRKED